MKVKCLNLAGFQVCIGKSSLRVKDSVRDEQMKPKMKLKEEKQLIVTGK